MFVFSCIQVIPIVHFGLWPQKDMPVKLTRYSRRKFFPNLFRGLAIGSVIGIEYLYSRLTYAYIQYLIIHGLGGINLYGWAVFGTLLASYGGAVILILAFQPFEPTVNQRWAYFGIWLLILPILGVIIGVL
jgi:hypothetical protein